MTETEKALLEIGQLLSQGGTAQRAHGGSHYWKFPTSPNLYTFQWRPDAFRRVTGFRATTGVNFAITKNGMTVSAAGLADTTGTALPEGSQVSANQVLFAGQTPSNLLPITGLNWPVYPGEIVYMSKNQAASIELIMLFDFE